MFITFLQLYPDGSYRMIANEKLNVGDRVSFKNTQWVEETKTIEEILEERPAKGEWKTRPKPYKLILA